MPDQTLEAGRALSSSRLKDLGFGVEVPAFSASARAALKLEAPCAAIVDSRSSAMWPCTPHLRTGTHRMITQNDRDNLGTLDCLIDLEELLTCFDRRVPIEQSPALQMLEVLSLFSIYIPP